MFAYGTINTYTQRKLRCENNTLVLMHLFIELPHTLAQIHAQASQINMESVHDLKGKRLHYFMSKRNCGDNITVSVDFSDDFRQCVFCLRVSQHVQNRADHLC